MNIVSPLIRSINKIHLGLDNLLLPIIVLRTSFSSPIDVLSTNELIFAISKNKVIFYDFAKYFKDL